MLHFGENRDRIRSLEQDLTVMKGRVDVAKAKEKSATDVEAFILDFLKTTNQQLKSKILFAFPLLFQSI